MADVVGPVATAAIVADDADAVSHVAVAINVAAVGAAAVAVVSAIIVAPGCIGCHCG